MFLAIDVLALFFFDILMIYYSFIDANSSETHLCWLLVALLFDTRRFPSECPLFVLKSGLLAYGIFVFIQTVSFRVKKAYTTVLDIRIYKADHRQAQILIFTISDWNLFHIDHICFLV